MFRFQYGVTTKASRERTWEIFSNWRRWNEFANIYGQMHWREGQPWEAGSRLEIEVVQPVNTVGVVLAQWVTFEEAAAGGTRVHTWGDIVHSGVKIAGQTAEHIITSFTKTWYENFRAACDQMVAVSGD